MENPATNSGSAPKTGPSSSGSGRDRRRQARSKENRPAWLHRGSNSDSVHMVDLSSGGACFLSQRAMSIGKPIKLQVGHGRTQATIEGVVVRQSQRPDGSFEIGMQVDHLGGFELSRRFPSRARVIV